MSVIGNALTQNGLDQGDVANFLDYASELPTTLDAAAKQIMIDTLQSLSQDERIRPLAKAYLAKLGVDDSPLMPSLWRREESFAAEVSSDNRIERESYIAATRAVKELARRVTQDGSRIVSVAFASARFAPKLDAEQLMQVAYFLGRGWGMKPQAIDEMMQLGAEVMVNGNGKGNGSVNIAGLTGGGPGNMFNFAVGMFAVSAVLSASLGMQFIGEEPHDEVHEALRLMVNHFGPRKGGLIQTADFILVAPGGFGTKEELDEAVMSMIAGEMQWKHIIFLETTTDKNFWPAFLAELRQKVDRGIIDPQLKDKLNQYLHYAKDLQEAMQYSHLAISEIQDRKNRPSVDLREPGNLSEENYITHYSNVDAYVASLEHDIGLMESHFNYMDPTHTIAFVGPAKMLEGEFAQLAHDIAKEKLAQGATILYSGNGEFGKALGRAVKEADNGFLFRVKRFRDDATALQEPSERRGEFYFNNHYMANTAMINHSGAYIIFPGAFEMGDFANEVITLIQTEKMKPKHLIFVGPKSDWEQYLKVVDDMIEYGTIAPQDKDIIKFAETAEEAKIILNGPQAQYKPRKHTAQSMKEYVLSLGLQSVMSKERADVMARQMYEAGINPGELISGYKSEIAKTHNGNREGQNALARLKRREMIEGPTFRRAATAIVARAIRDKHLSITTLRQVMPSRARNVGIVKKTTAGELYSALHRVQNAPNPIHMAKPEWFAPKAMHALTARPLLR